jgi:hypothetical protein
MQSLSSSSPSREDKRQVDILIFVLLAICAVSGACAFRIQRVALMIARSMGDRMAQAAMLPSWVNVVGWADFVLTIALAALIFFEFGWVWMLVFLVLSFVVLAVAGFLHVPPDRACFALFKLCLTQRIDGSLSRLPAKSQARETVETVYLELVLAAVRAIEKEGIS